MPLHGDWEGRDADWVVHKCRGYPSLRTTDRADRWCHTERTGHLALIISSDAAACCNGQLVLRIPLLCECCRHRRPYAAWFVGPWALRGRAEYFHASDGIREAPRACCISSVSQGKSGFPHFMGLAEKAEGRSETPAPLNNRVEQQRTGSNLEIEAREIGRSNTESRRDHPASATGRSITIRGNTTVAFSSQPQSADSTKASR